MSQFLEGYEKIIESFKSINPVTSIEDLKSIPITEVAAKLND
jgi:hypothetical protein